MTAVLSRGPGRGRGRSPRGAITLMYVLVAMPLLLLGSALSVDYLRIVGAAREIKTATDSAALAGAIQYASGQASLDQPAAEGAAYDFMSVAQGKGGGGGPIIHEITLSNVVDVRVTSSPTEVDVLTRYQVRGLMFFQFFAGQSAVEGSYTGTASVCLIGQVDPLGSCVRPS